MLQGKVLENDMLVLVQHEPQLRLLRASSWCRIRLGRSACKYWCSLLCSPLCILKSLVKLLQVMFLGVCQLLSQRLDDFIFVSDETLELLELSVLLLSPLIMLLGHILLGLRLKTLHRLSLLRNQLFQLLHS